MSSCAFYLLIELFPEIMVFIDEHFQAVFHLVTILIEVAIVEFLDRLRKLRIDLDKFFQTLLEHIVLLLEFLVALFELLELELAGEVVLESVHNLYILIMQAEPLKFQHKKILEFLMKEERELANLKAFLRSCEEFEKKGAENIGEFAKDMAAVGTKIGNKQLVKFMAGFSIHNIEKDHALGNVSLQAVRSN
jgi:hypothetical protein